MFTLDQINLAHSKVKSGADFPAYIQDLKVLGVTSYETFVGDGHTEYHGLNNVIVSNPASRQLLPVASAPDADQFKIGLKEHQQGKSDYPTFVAMCAKFGITKWTVSLEKMTCTYYDEAGHEILVENIPQ